MLCTAGSDWSVAGKSVISTWGVVSENLVSALRGLARQKGVQYSVYPSAGTVFDARSRLENAADPLTLGSEFADVDIQRACCRLGVGLRRVLQAGSFVGLVEVELAWECCRRGAWS